LPDSLRCLARPGLTLARTNRSREKKAPSTSALPIQSQFYASAPFRQGRAAKSVNRQRSFQPDRDKKTGAADGIDLRAGDLDAVVLSSVPWARSRRIAA